MSTIDDCPSDPPSPASSLRSGTPLTNGSLSSRDSRGWQAPHASFYVKLIYHINLGLTKPPSHSLLMSTPTSSRMAPPIFTGIYFYFSCRVANETRLRVVLERFHLSTFFHRRQPWHAAKSAKRDRPGISISGEKQESAVL